MGQVLDLLGFEPTRRAGQQWHGPCPLHESSPRRSRPFSVNLASGLYYCHQCRRPGNQLDLWAAASHLPLHPAAVELCHMLGRDVPWIHRW